MGKASWYNSIGQTRSLNLDPVIGEELKSKDDAQQFSNRWAESSKFLTQNIFFTVLKCIIWLNNCFISSKYKFRETEHHF